MLATLFFLTILSLLLSLFLTPIVRNFAVRRNLVDQPDNKRKVHKNPIPRVGGVALAAAYFGSLLAIAAWQSYHQSHLGPGFAAVMSIVPAAIVIFLIGLADDIFNLKPWQKFSVQIIAASMVVSAGVHIHLPAAFGVHPVLEAAVTMFWLAACTNAVNLNRRSTVVWPTWRILTCHRDDPDCFARQRQHRTRPRHRPISGRLARFSGIQLQSRVHLSWR